MTSGEDEVVLDGPMEFTFHGRDTQAWRWFLNGREVIVEVSDTAMESDLDMLPERTRAAIETSGLSEIERMRDWDVPNPHIFLSTEGLL